VPAILIRTVPGFSPCLPLGLVDLLSTVVKTAVTAVKRFFCSGRPLTRLAATRPQRPTGAQLRGELPSQATIPAVIDGLVDRLVTDMPGTPVGVGLRSQAAICSGLHSSSSLGLHQAL
jgi:hypothetical protein